MLNVTLIVLVGLTGCSVPIEGLEPPEETAEVVLQPDTVLLDSHTGVTDIEVGTDQITLTTLGWMQPLAPGSIVVGQRDGGYLRRVTEVITNDDRVVLRTEPATLGEAVRDGEAHAQVHLNDALRSAQVWDLGGRVLLDESIYSDAEGAFVDVSLFIADGAHVTLDPQFDFDLELFNGNWVDAGFSSRVSLDYEADFVANVAGAFDERVRSVVYTKRIPFAFEMGPVPVVGTADIQIIAGLEADFSGAGSATLHTEAHAFSTLGAGYDGEWWSEVDGDLSGDMYIAESSFDGHGNTKAWLEAQFTVELYGSAGADLTLIPWLEANVCGLDGIDIDAGLEGSHGYHFDALGWELFSWGPYPFEAGTWDLVECPAE